MLDTHTLDVVFYFARRGRPYSEGELIELAYAYEQKTQHRKPPPGFEELAN